MEDLLRSQILENCRLGLPEGLKDLMSDISREVLRAQPSNLLAFITNYLSALLVTRENLTVASRICNDICEDMTGESLEEELERIGMTPTDTETVKNIIMEQLTNVPGQVVKESVLLIKLVQKTGITEQQLPYIHEAVRRAIRRHHHDQGFNFTELPTDENIDDVTRAARHTLNLYRKAKPTKEEYRRAAQRIQDAYRAYGVKREKARAEQTTWSYSQGILSRSPASAKTVKQGGTTFHGADEAYEIDNVSIPFTPCSSAENASEKTDDIYVAPRRRVTVNTLSSSSLCGSYVNLPKYKPYTAIDIEAVQERDEIEDLEKENTNFDYTEDSETKEKVFITYERDETGSNESLASVQEELDIDHDEIKGVSDDESDENDDDQDDYEADDHVVDETDDNIDDEGEQNGVLEEEEVEERNHMID